MELANDLFAGCVSTAKLYSAKIYVPFSTEIRNKKSVMNYTQLGAEGSGRLSLTRSHFNSSTLAPFSSLRFSTGIALRWKTGAAVNINFIYVCF